jgi:dTDP-4-dehydrorhamnose reductase
MSLVILGATGQLGKLVKSNIQFQGISVFAPTRSEFDFSDPKLIRNYLERVKPSILLNCAAWTDVDLAESNSELVMQINAIGPAFAAKVCSEIGARFVQISTDYVFSGNREVPWLEESSPCPINTYGESKARCEELIFDALPNSSLIIRTSWLYGGIEKGFPVSIRKLLLSNNDTLRVVNDQIGQPTFIGEFADHLASLTLSNETGLLHCSNTGQTTWFDFAVLIAQSLGISSTRITPTSSSEGIRKAARPSYSVLSNEKIGRLWLGSMSRWDHAFRVYERRKSEARTIEI